MSHVFISYARSDEAIVRMVVNRMQTNGVAVWVDNEGLREGDIWRTDIANAIESSACVAVLCSPAAKRSVWIQREVAYARNHGIAVIPCLLSGDQTSVPVYLTATQWIDIRGSQKLSDCLPMFLQRIRVKEQQDTEWFDVDSPKYADFASLGGYTQPVIAYPQLSMEDIADYFLRARIYSCTIGRVMLIGTPNGQLMCSALVEPGDLSAQTVELLKAEGWEPTLTNNRYSFFRRYAMWTDKKYFLRIASDIIGFNALLGEPLTDVSLPAE